MNVGTFTTPNAKGQIVIPKGIRDKLGINEKVTLNITVSGNAIHIYPVSGFITSTEGESSYSQLLEKTKGSWGTVKPLSPAKSQLELAASKKRKKTW